MNVSFKTDETFVSGLSLSPTYILKSTKVAWGSGGVSGGVAMLC